MSKIIKSKSRNPISVKIGKNIRTYRRIRDLSQQHLGKVINVSCQQISKYESGDNDINVINLMAIAEALEVPLKSFLLNDVPLLHNTRKY
jgi:transcriptional regulator with XRE-family HTH domain